LPGALGLVKGRIVKLLSWRTAGIASLLIAATAATHAAEVNATFVAPVFQIGGTNISNDTNDHVFENPDGSFTLVGTESGGTGDRGWQLDWDFTIDYDPFINGSLTLTNLGSTRNFVLNVEVPVVPPITGSTLFGGSVAATVFDADHNGIATLTRSTAPDASPGIYQSFIDTSPVLNLFAVTPLECSGTVNCQTTFSEQEGLPGPTIPGPSVSQKIRTVLMFNLSAGDRVTFNTNFTVIPTPVPLPANAWLLLAALGCMGYVVARRNRADVTNSLSLRPTLAFLPGRA
jgi:hypothetical protein